MGVGSGIARFLLGSGRLLAQAAAGAPVPPARPWWLTVSSLLGNAAIVAGAVALLGAGRRQVTDDRGPVDGARRPGRIAAGGALLLALGALSHALLPAWPPRTREVISERIFSSARMPAIDLDLPRGWRLTHGTAEGVPDVVTATSPPVASPDAGAHADSGPDAGAGATAGAVLVVQSAHLDETVDVARLAHELTAGLERKEPPNEPPATTPPGAPTEATIDGLKALVVDTTRDDQTHVRIWIVKRADRFVSYVYCISQPDVTDGCAPAMARLRWHAPEPLVH